MKKLITALAIVCLMATTSWADFNISWSTNDPGGIATNLSLFYVEYTGQGNADLLAGTGFTEVPLQVSDTSYSLTGLSDGAEYCIYMRIISANSSFDTDVFKLSNPTPRQVINVPVQEECSIIINIEPVR